MNEFKFSCSQCGQHIAADETWCGRKINCPTCHTEIVVPSIQEAPPQSAVSGTRPQVAQGASAPPPGVRRSAAAPAAVGAKPRKSRLPIILAVVAAAGVLAVLAVGVVFWLWFSSVRKAVALQGPNVQVRVSTNGQFTFSRATEHAPQHNTISGTLFGQPFSCDVAQLQGDILHLNQGTNFLPEASIILFTFRHGDLAGQTVQAPGANGHPTPHVHVRWTENGRRQTKMFTGNYTMKLEFGQPTGDLMPGKIQLEIPGNPATKLSGDFTAEMR